MSNNNEFVEKAKQELKDIRQSVETARDEAKLKIHLAKADIKDEWDELEKDFENYQARMTQWEDTTIEPDKIMDSARELGQKLKNGYQNIKDKMKS